MKTGPPSVCRTDASPAAEYQIFDTEHSLKIVTEGIQMIYDKQKIF